MGKGEGDNMKFLTGLAVLCCGILSAAAAEASRLTFVKTACAAGISARVENPGNLEILATGNQPWMGIHLRPEQGEHWDFSGFGSFECEVENRNQDGFCGVAFYMNDQLLGRSSIRPGETKPLRFRLNHAGPSRFDPGFPPGLQGVPIGFRGGRNFDSSRVTRFRVELFAPGKVRLSVRNCRVSGRSEVAPEVTSPERFFPCIDRYGQYIHREWPQKIHSDEELRRCLREEAGRLRAPVAGWNRYGGWAEGPQLKATGFFRTEKYQGKWWLVDPEGRLFFSRGLNSIRSTDLLTGGPGLEKFFEGKSTRKDGRFGFTSANLRRKYGPDYRNEFNRFMLRRLADWGFNTIGNWSDQEICRMRRIPYVVNLPLPAGLPRLAKGGFYDVFDPAFEPGMQKIFSRDFDWCRNDPWCIGIFVGNELRFANRKRSLGTDTLIADPATAAKQELIRDLRKKYGSIEALNRVWKCDFPDWEALARLRSLPEGDNWREDIDEFFEKSVRRFFSVSRAVVKAGSPNTLYLGSRLYVGYDYTNRRLNRAAAACCDVVSYNLYQPVFDHFAPHGMTDVPIIITESTVGGELERGTWGPYANPGTMPGARREVVSNQYESAARHPNLVGIHFFPLFDQPVLGRWDGENCNFGAVDITDTPYRDVVEANRAFSERLYPFRSGSRALFSARELF